MPNWWDSYSPDMEPDYALGGENYVLPDNMDLGYLRRMPAPGELAQPISPELAEQFRQEDQPSGLFTGPRSFANFAWESAKGLPEAVWGAVTLPGDVAEGRVDPNSPEALQRSLDLAGTVTLGGGMVPARAATSASGLRSGFGHIPHERVDTAAIRTPDGKVYTGNSHFEAFERVPEYLREDNRWTPEEGFVTNEGRFVDRGEAFNIANRSRQIDDTITGQDKLTSEDLDPDRIPFQDRGLMDDDWDTFANKSKAAGAGALMAADPYLRSERFLNSPKVQPKATPDQWRSMMEKASVKPEEMETLGLTEFLRNSPGPVTKEQLLAHIDQNHPRLGETVLGSKGLNPHDVDWSQEASRDQLLDYFDDLNQDVSDLSTQEIRALIDDPNEFNQMFLETYMDLESGRLDLPNNPTKYSQYTTPGGENYREILIKLPEPKRIEVRKSSEGGLEAYDTDTGVTVHRQRPNEDIYSWVEAENQKGQTPDSRIYKSPHWDQPNVMTHMRVNDRLVPDAAGTQRKTLHVEEIQDDWAQAGRKRGYRTKDKPKYVLEGDGPWTIRTEDGRYIYDSNNREAAQIALDDLNRGEGALSHLDDTAQSSKVPDRPFKKSWPDLALKRLVQEAVDGGYDQISWTTGKTQADRYSLGNHIDALQWKERENGNYDLHPWKNGQAIHNMGNELKDISPDQLPEVLGQEIAGKIINNKGTIDPDGVRRGNLSKLDLHIGGEGMKRFYDQELVRRANKLFGKYGAKVEKGALEGKSLTPSEVEKKIANSPIRDGIDERVFDILEVNEHDIPEAIRDAEHRLKEAIDYGDPPEYSQSVLDRLNQYIDKWSKNKQSDIHVLPITPELKRVVQEEGLPLFANKSKAGALTLFHGSPYDFEEFSLKGQYTGEGANVFGEGLYFAENPAVAKGYMKNGRDVRLITKDGEELTKLQIDNMFTKNKNLRGKEEDFPYWYLPPIEDFLESELGSTFSKEKALLRLKKSEDWWTEKTTDPEEFSRMKKAFKEYSDFLGTLDQISVKKPQLYRIQLDEDPERIADLDRRVRDQDHPILDVLLPYLEKADKENPIWDYPVSPSKKRIMKGVTSIQGFKEPNGDWVSTTNAKDWNNSHYPGKSKVLGRAASPEEALNRALNYISKDTVKKGWKPNFILKSNPWIYDLADRLGLKIDGQGGILQQEDISAIKFLDGVSRNKGKGQRNYIVWNEKIIKDLEKVDPDLFANKSKAAGAGALLSDDYRKLVKDHQKRGITGIPEENPIPTVTENSNPLKVLTPMRSEAFDLKSTPVIDLPVEQISTWQNIAEPSKIRPLSKDYPPIHVGKVNDNLVVFDGNHRLISAMHEGSPTIRAKFVDFDDPKFKKYWKRKYRTEGRFAAGGSVTINGHTVGIGKLPGWSVPPAPKDDRPLVKGPRSVNIEDRRRRQSDRVQRRNKADRIPDAVSTLVSPPDDLYLTPPHGDEDEFRTDISDWGYGVPTSIEGLIKDTTPGRTDRLPVKLPANSYVIPADVVSGLGQGNTDGGGVILDQMFSPHKGMASGGTVTSTGEPVDVVVAGGEYVVSPLAVTSIGHGDPERGHRVLDRFVRDRRRSTIKVMSKLPGPRKD